MNDKGDSTESAITGSILVADCMYHIRCVAITLGMKEPTLSELLPSTEVADG